MVDHTKSHNSMQNERDYNHCSKKLKMHAITYDISQRTQNKTKKGLKTKYIDTRMSKMSMQNNHHHQYVRWIFLSSSCIRFIEVIFSRSTPPPVPIQRDHPRIFLLAQNY